jgi:hypothetical protein
VSAIRPDKRNLETVARVSFTQEQFAELQFLITTYAERFEGEVVAPAHMWPDLASINKFEQEARLTFVEGVRQIWSEAGGRGYGSHAVPTGGAKGPLLALVIALLRSTDKAGLWTEMTLHHDIVQIATGRIRNRGR